MGQTSQGEPKWSALAYIPFTAEWNARVGWEMGEALVDPSNPIDVSGFNEGVPGPVQPWLDEGKRQLTIAVVVGTVSLVVVGGGLLLAFKVLR